jgi:hypothetical protein
MSAFSTCYNAVVQDAGCTMHLGELSSSQVHDKGHNAIHSISLLNTILRSTRYELFATQDCTAEVLDILTDVQILTNFGRDIQNCSPPLGKTTTYTRDRLHLENAVLKFERVLLSFSLMKNFCPQMRV